MEQIRSLVEKLSDNFKITWGKSGEKLLDEDGITEVTDGSGNAVFKTDITIHLDETDLSTFSQISSLLVEDDVKLGDQLLRKFLKTDFVPADDDTLQLGSKSLDKDLFIKANNPTLVYLLWMTIYTRKMIEIKNYNIKYTKDTKNRGLTTVFDLIGAYKSNRLGLIAYDESTNRGNYKFKTIFAQDKDNYYYLDDLMKYSNPPNTTESDLKSSNNITKISKNDVKFIGTIRVPQLEANATFSNYYTDLGEYFPPSGTAVADLKNDDKTFKEKRKKTRSVQPTPLNFGIIKANNINLETTQELSEKTRNTRAEQSSSQSSRNNSLRKLGRKKRVDAPPPTWDCIGFGELGKEAVKNQGEQIINYIPVNPWIKAPLDQAQRGTCVGFAAVEFLRMGHSIYDNTGNGVGTGGSILGDLIIGDTYWAVEDLFNKMKCIEYDRWNFTFSSIGNFFESIFGITTKREGWEESDRGLDGSWLEHYYEVKANNMPDVSNYEDAAIRNIVKPWDNMNLNGGGVDYYTTNVVQYPVFNNGDCFNSTDGQDYRYTNTFSPHLKLATGNTRPISWSSKSSETRSLTFIKQKLQYGPVMVALHWRDDKSIPFKDTNDDDQHNYLNKFYNGSNVWSLESDGTTRAGKAKKNGGGHAVVVVGYSDSFDWNTGTDINSSDRNQKGGFICKNSWGLSGNQGMYILTYARLKADCKEICYYNQKFTADYDRADDYDLAKLGFAKAVAGTTKGCIIL